MHHIIRLLVREAVTWRTWNSKVARAANSLWICCWINNLRKVSFSPGFLSCCTLLGCLRINLLLLHGIVLLTVIYGQLVQASTSLIAALRRPTNSLQLPKIILTRWIIMAHNSLHWPLLIESRNLRHRWLPILRPVTINGILACSLLPLCILAALPVLLIRSHLDRVRPTIDLLLWLVLLVRTAHVLSNNKGILI